MQAVIGAQYLKHRVLGIAHFFLFVVPLQPKPRTIKMSNRPKVACKARTTTAIPTEMKVLMNHIYELHKGVRHMVLFTCNESGHPLPAATSRATESERVFRAARVSGGHSAHRHPSAEPAHARRGLHPRRHARLRHLRTMRKVLQA